MPCRAAVAYRPAAETRDRRAGTEPLTPVKVSGLDHATLAMSDLDRSLAFYRDLLGMTLRARWAEGTDLEAGGLWLCLSVGPAAPRP